jgi:methylase of polypeptide subunit release factors
MKAPGFSQSGLVAKLKEFVSRRREQVGLYNKIAEHLGLGASGRILDVGTGSGSQLKVLHKMNPGLELTGLDVSRAALQIAQQNLCGIEVDLREGDIGQAPYADDFFHLVKQTVSCFISRGRQGQLCLH